MTNPMTERCPNCRSAEVQRLVPDWQARVQRGERVPIVGCGNPFHYDAAEFRDGQQEVRDERN